MKKIKAIVKDKTTIELVEPGEVGDVIDLSDLVEVDTSYLETIIEEGKDRVYLTKLEQAKKLINAENDAKLEKLKAEINSLTRTNEQALKLKEQEVNNKYANQIAELTKKIELIENENRNKQDAITKEHQIALLNAKNESEAKYSKLESDFNAFKASQNTTIEKNKLEVINSYQAQINDLKNKYDHDLALKDAQLEKNKVAFELEKEKALATIRQNFDNLIKQKDDKIYNLLRTKASLNVKQTGEDLEAWCDNEVTSYMQNGLFNCTWTKDNKVIKEEDEIRGSKADYIFKVFANNEHNENELLATICMDMKDENPDSINKKSNADYYKQLDKNRIKKDCKYALLVSNLEMDKPNVLPIFKVREYEDMYVVRPAYLMTFLNMITSLTTRFASLINSKDKEALELQNKVNLVEEFDNIKNTYLDKPLESLEKNVEAISKDSETIKKVCRDIDEQCDKINRNYISQIQEKLNKFSLKLDRSIVKKL